MVKSVKQYDSVKLKNNIEGVVNEIYENEEGIKYEIEYISDNTGEYPEYETVLVGLEEIAGVFVRVYQPLEMVI